MSEGTETALDRIGLIRLLEHTIDLRAERLLDRSGQVIELRPQAFAVLRSLASNAGRMMTKDELVAHVWPNATVTDDSLVQAVRDARKALGDSGHRVIETVRGRGYLVPLSEVLESTKVTPTGIVPANKSKPMGAIDQAKIVTNDATGRENAFSRNRPHWGLIAVLVAILGVAGVWYLYALKSDSVVVKTGPFPTVAVLLFGSFDTDSALDALAAGFSEDLATELARSRHIQVISTASSFAISSAGMNDQQMAIKLRTQYLVDGRVGVQDGELRLQIRLNDAANGRVVWAVNEKMDMAGLGKVHESLVAQIAGTVVGSVYDSETEQRIRRGTENLDAYSLAMSALGRTRRFHPVEFRKGRSEAEQAIAIDPEFGHAWIHLGYLDFLDSVLSITGERSWKDFEKIEQTLQRGINLTPGSPFGWLGMASLRAAQERPEEALGLTKRALSVAPNNPQSLLLMGKALISLNRADEAEKFFTIAEKVFPIEPPYFNLFFSRFHWIKGNHEKALEFADACLAQAPHFSTCWIEKIVTLTDAGRMQEASEVGKEMRRVIPRVGIRLFRATFTTIPSLLARREAAAKAAGFSDDS